MVYLRKERGSPVVYYDGTLLGRQSGEFAFWDSMRLKTRCLSASSRMQARVVRISAGASTSHIELHISSIPEAAGIAVSTKTDCRGILRGNPLCRGALLRVPRH